MIVRKRLYKGIRYAVSLLFLAVLLSGTALFAPGTGLQALCAEADVYIPLVETDHYVYTDPETGYSIYMEDNAGLFTDEEKAELITVDMQPITAYGNVGFVSTVINNIYTEDYAEQRYRELFGTQSGTLFVVDMDNRVLALWSDGDVYRTIDRNMADTIMDNVYRKASGGDYLGMTKLTYRQILAKLQGQRIAQPMKYITNALFAVILALLINYMLVRRASSAARPGRGEILGALDIQEKVSNPSVKHRSTSKKYDPPTSTSSGSSGSRSGGGGGGGGGFSGGGGHSGGGGSHRF